MRLEALHNTLIEAQIHFGKNIKSGLFHEFAVYGDETAGIPAEVYSILDNIGHNSGTCIFGDSSDGRPYYIGWARYRVLQDKLVIVEIQSDVLELTSKQFTRHLQPQDAQLINRYRSRLENRYRHWHFDVLMELVDRAKRHGLRKVELELCRELEAGVRRARMKRIALRAGFTYAGDGIYELNLKSNRRSASSDRRPPRRPANTPNQGPYNTEDSRAQNNGP